MDAFGIRDGIIDEYADYVRSFIRIKDSRIKSAVEKALAAGHLWPDPLIQLNPSFQQGETLLKLVDEGILHPKCLEIFCVHSDAVPSAKPLRLYRHQVEAIKAADTGRNYVLTTGTGSGKSLAYVVPIVNHVLKSGSGKGIQAIVVYPMNALANSQLGELGKFLSDDPKARRLVTFERYTGQENDEDRQRIISAPPDILLTNYVMLELLLTRYGRGEDQLIQRAKGLRFLVFDELHTYRGRQGADVAMLIRRVRETLQAESLQCVGTSATLAGKGSTPEQRSQIADLATSIFGSVVLPEQVIGESLERSATRTDGFDSDDSLRVSVLRCAESDLPASWSDLLVEPLAIWIEHNLGLSSDPGSGELVRAKPRGISQTCEQLSRDCELDATTCQLAIQSFLSAVSAIRPEATDDRRAFAFRLHQFISKGDTVYSTLENAEDRLITLRGQRYAPHNRDSLLFPMAFCRECGQEFYTVFRVNDGSGSYHIEQRRFRDLAPDDSESGYVFECPERPWPQDEQGQVERVPEDWVDESRDPPRIAASKKKYLPEAIRLGPDGQAKPTGHQFHYLASPFCLCPFCGVSYDARVNEFEKLAALSSEGRSTATTVLCLSAIERMRASADLPPSARKVLSFTDNRQDASLQAGHFNDYVCISQLRAGLYRAVLEAGSIGIGHVELVDAVFAALSLAPQQYASEPAANEAFLRDVNFAFKDVLGYRLYRDMEKGWRVVLPNLEQCGLLDVRYSNLSSLCEDSSHWIGLHSTLVSVDAVTRENVCRVLLDFLRRSLAIKVDYLDPDYQSKIKQRSFQHLIDPWRLDEDEELVKASILYPRASGPRDSRSAIFLSGLSNFGRFLRRPRTLKSKQPLTVDEAQGVIIDLLETLRRADIIEQVRPAKGLNVAGYQLKASAMRWHAGDGHVRYHDVLRMPTVGSEVLEPNKYFVNFYSSLNPGLDGIQAGEHTAQVQAEVREEREEAFRLGDLPVLYCSPTMELGVDISQLNLVHMRNVPPTPANYAQRSGRAGRSGQPALVMTYCTSGSSHDQYYFRRSSEMVSGAVKTPRIDLTNEDLLRSHMHAIWLAETKVSLRNSVAELLEVDSPEMPLLPSIQKQFADKSALTRAKKMGEAVLRSLDLSCKPPQWWHPGWLHEVLDAALLNFDRACDRWRGLYASALREFDAQGRRSVSHAISSAEREEASRRQRSARAQIELLAAAGSSFQSDFYSYRYFSSEGFLPGYNFPRLPLSAFIPARRGSNKGDDFISRPRFLAISEFGPESHIYYEGSVYEVSQIQLEMEGEGLVTREAKLCGQCGYLHNADGPESGDRCQSCDAPLGPAITELYRMTNVTTRRRERITANEEERQRAGYEIVSSFSFRRGADGRLLHQSAQVVSEGRCMATLAYGDAANVWRINMGWRRRDKAEGRGYYLNRQRARWMNRKEVAKALTDPNAAASVSRVVPFVEDTRNVLVVDFAEHLPPSELTTLAHALKVAVLNVYQLEDNELSLELLPTPEDPRRLLLYESSEGGAGVLRQLLQRGAIAELAVEALRVCHFDPETGEDQHRAESATEDCEAACYDCLLSYGNQTAHKLLDRQKALPYLLALKDAVCIESPSALPRAEHLQRLGEFSASSLERQWLSFLEEHQFALPDKAQVLIESCGTRPDFAYSEHQVLIYVDGPVHQYPDRRERDRQQAQCLSNLGYLVLRFAANSDWLATAHAHPDIFGSGK